MIIKTKLGKLESLGVGEKQIDYLDLEWYELSKRIINKSTRSGREVFLKFLGQSEPFQQDDVLYADQDQVIAVDVIACDAIELHPSSMFEMASLCYEIGNKHVPLFYEGETILVPFELPLFRLLENSGFNPRKVQKKLLHSFKTTVSPHEHVSGNSLFTRIMRLTQNA
jgi:urease accessory protein